MKPASWNLGLLMVLFAVSQTVAATSVEDFVSDTLVGISATPPQASIGFVIGQICPSSPPKIVNQDLQDRCNEVAVAGIGGNLATQDGLQAMAPEEDAVIASSQVDASGAQIDNIGNRLAGIRGGGAAAGIVYNNSGINWSGGAAGDGAGSPWGFFVNGLYVDSDRDETARESGFDANDWGVTGGIDYTFSGKVVLGAAFGYKNSDADIDANGGRLETDSYSYFVYWSLYPDDAWYVDAMIGYTDNDHDQKRNIAYTIPALGGGTTTVNNSALSDTDSDELSFSLTAGRDFHTGPWTLSPYARFEYADVDIDGFTERMSQPAATVAGSGLALNIDDQDIESMTATAGGTAIFEWQTSWGMVYPQATIEYTHEFKNSNDPITGRFVNDSSRTTFLLLTDPPDRNYLNVGAGVTATFTDNIAGFFRYQGLLDYKDLDVNAFEVGIRVDF